MPLLSTLHSLPRLHSTALHMATGSSRGDDDTSSAVDSKAWKGDKSREHFKLVMQMAARSGFKCRLAKYSYLLPHSVVSQFQIVCTQSRFGSMVWYYGLSALNAISVLVL